MMNKIPLIVCVDFDGTIVNNGPDNSIISLKPAVKTVLNLWNEMGIYVIIWTCRTGDTQIEAEIFLKENKINYDKINDHSSYTYRDWPKAGKKVYADIYIDDRNHNNNDINWQEIHEYVKLKNIEHLKKYENGNK